MSIDGQGCYPRQKYGLRYAFGQWMVFSLRFGTDFDTYAYDMFLKSTNSMFSCVALCYYNNITKHKYDSM